jgi:hypothetical protein
MAVVGELEETGRLTGAAAGGRRSGGDGPRQPRPYTLTRGRTRPDHRLRADTHLAVGPAAPAEGLPREAAQVIDICRRRSVVSVAEVSALMGVPLWATKIIVSDQLTSGAVALCTPAAEHQTNAALDAALLERVLVQLRAAF